MRKINFFSIMACLLMLTAACNKDKDSEPDRTPSISIVHFSKIASFADLNSFIGRTDIAALKSDFSTDDYWVRDKTNGFSAEKHYETSTTTQNTSYNFEVSQGVITSANFHYGESFFPLESLKVFVSERINEEINYSSGKTMESYSGHIINGTDTLTFQSRDEFNAWLSSAVLAENIKGDSECTYDNYITKVDIYYNDCGITITRR